MALLAVMGCVTTTDKRQTQTLYPTNKCTLVQIQVTELLLQALKVVTLLCAHPVH